MKTDVTTYDTSRGDYHHRAYASIGNNKIITTRLEYRCSKIGKELSGFKIAHISDLHNHAFGDGQERLVCAVKDERPDIIVVTGDSIDRRRTDIDSAMEFFSQAAKLSPVYFVTGNHEALSRDYKMFSKRLADAGINILDNDYVIINHNNTSIKIIGLPDAAFFGYGSKTDGRRAKQSVKDTLKRLIAGESCFCILLTHRPELINIYGECGADIVFAGHAHGGQMRLPFLGGLYAPSQGILPKYTSGIYKHGGTALVVSRGLGNSLFPLRIFNPPEVLTLTLKCGVTAR